jgi:GNAT superfamily N-acetyltransferase
MPGDPVRPFPYAVRTYRKGDEDGIVQVLVRCHPDTWGILRDPASYWRWKHAERPGFRPEDIVVVEAGGRIVGCFHSAVFPLRVEPGLVMPVSFDGDYAVLPEYRGDGLTARAYELSDPALLRRRVVFRGGFTSHELNQRLYQHFGYVFVPTVGTYYRKHLRLEGLKERVQRLGGVLLSGPALRRVLDARTVIANVDVSGLPPARVTLGASGFSLEEGFAARADISVRLPYRLLAALGGGVRRAVLPILGSLLGGSLRIRGVWRLATISAAATQDLLRRRRSVDGPQRSGSR